VLGAREVLPTFTAGVQVPADILDYAPALAFDPIDSEMLLRLDDSSIRHPLADGSEAHYRFAAGDTTVIRLPDGRSVRLRELRIQPRRSDPQLVSGSFWLEAETHAVVQAFFRLARPYDSRRDGGGSMLGSLRAELEFIALDYGLWELRWWLPRSVVASGSAQFGAFRVPLSFERRYDDYRIVGDTSAFVPVAGDSIRPPRCRPSTMLAVQAQTRVADPDDAVFADRMAQRDSARQERLARRAERAQAVSDSLLAAGDTAGAARAAPCERAFIVSHASRSALLTSELLPPAIYAAESGIVLPSELDEIMQRARRIPRAPWQLARPALQWGPQSPGLLRYNRVEGLSVGARALLDFGRLGGDAEFRVSTEGVVGARLGVQREGFSTSSAIAAYRRLDIVDIGSGAFGVGSSLAALLLGRDDHDYFRATGVELTLRPAESRAQWYDLRLFAERQAAVDTGTRFSVRHLLDSAHGFRPNIAADAADQLGAALSLRATAGLNPRAPRLAAEVQLLGETGDFTFVRPAAVLRTSAPLGRRFAVMLEGAGGSGFGDASVQRFFQIGGGASVRGFDAATMRGDTYWRGTAEVGAGLPFARLAAFTDIGWAGPRDALRDGRPLRSAGAGISLLDGLLRFDVARALEPAQWRAHVRFMQ
jgi:hypothetical protein